MNSDDKQHPEKRKIRYVVVGLGNIAQVAILPAFAHAHENSELVGLVSSDPEKLAALSKKYGVEARGSYENLEDVVRRSSADAVYIALPSTMHRTMTERAAALGLHVLCEKPMAVTIEDCEAMIAATRAANVRLMIVYRLHFQAANLAAIDRIRKGDIGEPRIFSSVFTQQVREGDTRTRGELGGGAIYDMGIYCINAARQLFQDEPLEVFATQVRDHDARFQGVDESTTAVLLFAGGRTAQLTASQAAAAVSEYRVVGTKGDIRLEPAFGYAKGLDEYETVDGKTKKDSFSRRAELAPELAYFSDCILGNTAPEPSGEEGLCDVRILRAIEASAKSGQKVRLAPFYRDERPNVRLEMRNPRSVRSSQ